MILSQIIGIDVVPAVGRSPGKIRRQKERVGSPANNVVEQIVSREGTMSALMSDDLKIWSV